MEEIEKVSATLNPVIGDKLAGCKPSLQEQQKESPATRCLYRLWDQLQLINGILYCCFPLNGQLWSFDKLVVPKTLWNEILEDLHAGALGGHLGEVNTLSKLKEHFYWPGKCNDLCDWCHTCTTCASHKTPTPSLNLNTFS